MWPICTCKLESFNSLMIYWLSKLHSPTLLYFHQVSFEVIKDGMETNPIRQKNKQAEGKQILLHVASNCDYQTDCSAILQTHLDCESPFVHFYTYMRFNQVVLELLSLLRTFDNSSKCIKISFNSDS